MSTNSCIWCQLTSKHINICLIHIKTAPYFATTCKGLFLRCQQINFKSGGQILPFSWLLSEGTFLYRKNLEEILEKRQSLSIQLSRNYERAFLQRHTITFWTEKISSRTSIFCNLISLFIRKSLLSGQVRLFAAGRYLPFGITTLRSFN